MPSVVGVKGVNACDVGYISENNNAGAVGNGPLSTALNMVDKKVRNLEKRKCKLDGYRADSERGKELNSDQKSAIAKYDEVLHTLEFARELSAQFRSLCQEDDRMKKKAAKRENAERNRYEAGRVTQILKLQSLLKKTNSVAGWEDVANIDAALVKGMKAFMDLVNTSEHAAAEHYLALIDAKPGKKCGEVTYAQLKDAFTTLETAIVAASTPLEQEQEEEQQVVAEETEEEEEEEVVAAVTVPVPVEAPSSPPQEEGPQEHSETLMMPVNGAADHALPPQQQEFNFLQESQIDPINMDPAVVVVQHSPPQVFNPQGGHMYPPIPFHQTTAAPYHPPQPTMSHSDPPAAPLQPQNEAQDNEASYHHSNSNHTSKMSHSKNMEPESQEPNSAQPPPTIEDWSEENEVARENGGHYRGRGRGRGGYRAPRKDNGYRGGRGGRGGRSRGGGGTGNMNGTGHHYRGEKEYRGRGGRGTRGGSYRGSVEKSNGNCRD